MKLAEALLERADIKTKINILRSRLVNNAKTQEGVEVSENPQELINELDRLLERLDYLVVHINRTNNSVTNTNGENLASMLSKRDCLTQKISVLRDFTQAGSEILGRISRSEIKILPTFNISKMQTKLDELSKELRTLDSEIQALNWTSELC